MTLPVAFTYGTVKGLLDVATTGAAGGVPGAVALAGQVTFTSSVHGARLLSTGSVPPLTTLVPPVPVALAPDGSFVVQLLATDNTLINPLAWTWTATFSCPGYTIDPITFSLPAGSTVDITSVTPVAESGGTLITQGAPGAPTNMTIGTVTTLAVGSPATASISGTPPNSVLSLGLPRGATGDVPGTRLVSAGTGLAGGGNLSADRSFAVAYGTTAGTAAQGNDSRLTDARKGIFTDRGAWTGPGTAYAYGDVVTNSGQRWLTKIPHTSGATFSGTTNWISIGVDPNANNTALFGGPTRTRAPMCEVRLTARQTLTANAPFIAGSSWAASTDTDSMYSQVSGVSAITLPIAGRYQVQRSGWMHTGSGGGGSTVLRYVMLNGNTTTTNSVFIAETQLSSAGESFDTLSGDRVFAAGDVLSWADLCTAAVYLDPLYGNSLSYVTTVRWLGPN